MLSYTLCLVEPIYSDICLGERFAAIDKDNILNILDYNCQFREFALKLKCTHTNKFSSAKFAK